MVGCGVRKRRALISPLTSMLIQADQAAGSSLLRLKLDLIWSRIVAV